MALGKYGKLFVRYGEVNIDPALPAQDTPEEMGAMLAKMMSNATHGLIKGSGANIGDFVEPNKGGDDPIDAGGVPTGTEAPSSGSYNWYQICRVDANLQMSRSNIDTSDTCSGSWGSSVPGTPDVTFTFNSYKKIGAARTVWQSMLLNRFENAESIGRTGHVTVVYLDGPPAIEKDGGFPGGAVDGFFGPTFVPYARGFVFVAKVYNASESHPFAGSQELSFELRPSGDSKFLVPMRQVVFPATVAEILA